MMSGGVSKCLPLFAFLEANLARRRCVPNRATLPVVIFSPNVRLFEIALVLVRLDHVASVIVNANHSIM
jgi:hypothetical protein